MQEDAAALSLDDLVDRLQHVAARGTKVDRILWGRYGARQLESLVAEGRARAGGRAREAIETDRLAEEALAAVNAALADPQATSKRATAEAPVKAAREAMRTIRRRQFELGGSQGRVMAAARVLTAGTHGEA